MKLAVIGTGIAGSAAAWALAQQHDVTVYEREPRLGGHSHTVTVDHDGSAIAVDVGFIVYNALNYPELTALFDHLGIETVESCMSFSVSADGGRFEWMGGGGGPIATARGLFAQPSNLASPSYLGMLRDILVFNRASVEDYHAGRLAGMSLGDYLGAQRYTPRLLSDYLAPMGAAIWSAPADRILDFPAENFVAFFNNHRLLRFDRPVWRTVKGGSRTYVDRLAARFRHGLRLGCAVVSVERTPGGVIITDSGGGRNRFDQVVLATHSDDTLRLLRDADRHERAVLGALPYAPNAVYLHRDPRLMPKRRRAWASWNFLRWARQDEALNDVAVTYWMNRLQGIAADKPLFVSLNPPFAPDPAHTFGRYVCHHPRYDARAFAAQRRLPAIQGRRRTWFCGAWTGYGFHEDGLRSALTVAEALGATIPWRQPSQALAPAALAEAAE